MKAKVKKKMQNVSFNTVDEFLDFLPAEELLIVDYLRKIIFDCLPECEERLAYNVPFYRRHSNLFFIWPPSVKWGNTGHSGVRFGFTNGNLLSDETNYLDRGSRKQVYWKDFQSIKEIDVDLIKAFIFEASIIDEEKAKGKRRRI
jgi:hypothetical protein